MASDLGTSPDKEKFSGLRITDRKIPGKRWDDMMRGKRYVAFPSLSATSTAASDNIVAIGVLCSRSQPKYSSTGNRYVFWSLTDLAFPQPQLLTLFLHGDAFEAWDAADLGKSVSTGAVLALLNPEPLADRGGSSAGKSQDEKSRVAVKITQATQIVVLGSCPSLGFCSCKKKDGMSCSMPCDRDRGAALVCFYHTKQQEAQKVRQWSKSNTSSSSGSGMPGGKTSSVTANGQGGIFVLPMALPKRALGEPLQSTPARSAVAAPKVPKEDAALRRLMEGPDATPGGKACSGRAADAKKTSRGPSNPEVQATASRNVAHETNPSSQVSIRANSSQAPGPDNKEAKSFLERQILARFPGGIPPPTPNESTSRVPGVSAASSQQVRASQNRTPNASSLSSMAAGLSVSGGSKRFGKPASKKADPAEANPGSLDRPPAASQHVISSNGSTAQKSQATNTKSSKKTVTPAEFKKLEMEYGRKIALQLSNDADPRKNMIRMQSSQFKGAVEEERDAKRMRRLAELEQQDDAQEKMAALTFMMVQAYRCRDCSRLYDSGKQRAFCHERGHVVTEVQAKKTRWECANCKWSEEVLDRELPPHCNRCNGLVWKPAPLRRIRREAPMEKDLFLPRGEELPFVNSIHIPGCKPLERRKEAKDDYDGL
eukprot:TRINITY_DN26195_c0_g1_i1.p1 TRINITY_DN26195_c0_g1~~TRINITY_DN26195_c0_g1_i1.p1  ORF type:complete len:656 (+),score=121.24 TRINITY_DN26195_c0_g1_i1:127-2094(+)